MYGMRYGGDDDGDDLEIAAYDKNRIWLSYLREYEFLVLLVRTLMQDESHKHLVLSAGPQNRRNDSRVTFPTGTKDEEKAFALFLKILTTRHGFGLLVGNRNQTFFEISQGSADGGMMQIWIGEETFSRISLI